VRFNELGDHWYRSFIVDIARITNVWLSMHMSMSRWLTIGTWVGTSIGMSCCMTFRCNTNINHHRGTYKLMVSDESNFV